MPRLYLTGASGFIGHRVIARTRPGWQITAQWRSNSPPPGAADQHRVDLGDAASVALGITSTAPDVLLHTAYDMAAGADANITWTRNVLTAAATVGTRVIFMSTDLVFDGERGWYREDDPPSPTLDYGRWKAAMEREVAHLGGTVVRTSLVWCADPPSLPIQRMILDPLRRGESPRLFADEWRSPTEVDDLAEGLWEAITASQSPGILHLSGPERITRYDHGRLIARRFGLDDRFPPAFRSEVAPDRPRDTSLAVTEITRQVVRRTRFRGPSELLA